MTAPSKNAILKNTWMLYVRMAFTMLIAFYASRVLLQAIGVENFGIYNVIGSCVVLFAFLNSVMSSAALRFFSFELGKANGDISKYFSASLLIHAAIALIFILVSELFAPLVLNTIVDIPQNRIWAANWVLQCSIFITGCSFIQIPFESLIISHEKMSFYAFSSILFSLLKLLIIFLLGAIRFDSLITYVMLLLMVNVTIIAVYALYCRFSFPNVRLKKIDDRKVLKSILSFSGWSALGGGATMMNSQGINLIINNYCGVLASAAIGIANQISYAVMQFVNNFQTAFKPQLIKLCASNENEEFERLILFSSKISFLLIFIPAIPILAETRSVLGLWLGVVPAYSVEFVRMTLLFIIIDAVSAPLWLSVQAVGKIRKYQMIVSCAIMLNIPIALAIVYFDAGVIYILLSRVVINFLLWVWRVFYLKKLTPFDTANYLKNILVKFVLLAALVFLPFLVFESESVGGKITNVALSEAILLAVFFFWIITRQERSSIMQMLSKYLRR